MVVHVAFILLFKLWYAVHNQNLLQLKFPQVFEKKRFPSQRLQNDFNRNVYFRNIPIHYLQV
jgi:hypothetical protein